MSGVDLDEASGRARVVLGHDHRQLPRLVAHDVLAMADELVVLRELVDCHENVLATADAERMSAARSAEMWKAKAEAGLASLLRHHSVDRFSITYSGVCCGMTMTLSGLDSEELPETEAIEAPCLSCGRTVRCRLVGVCLAPFVAHDPTGEDEEVSK